MDRLHMMAVYISVAEEGSLAKGARRLAMSAPAVSRSILSLEQHLGCTLLIRTTRYLRLTEAGQRFLVDAKRILADIAQAEQLAAGANAAPRGSLSITAPVLFGKMYIVPVLCDYLRRFPEMEASLTLTDQIVNLVEDGHDVALRVGELPDSNMHAARVGSVRRVVCAAPAYLDRAGNPAHPNELQNHTIITALNVSPMVEWRFLDADDATFAVRLRPRLTTTTNDSAIEAAINGFGLTCIMSYQVAHHVASGQLVRVLSGFEQAPLPVHIVHREGTQPSAKVRSFIDMASAALRPLDFLA